MRFFSFAAALFLAACNPTVQRQLEVSSSPTAPPPPRVLETRLPPTKQQSHGPLIVLDPGHGGHDRGAECRSLGYPEKQAALLLSQLLEHRLSVLGYRVLLTRSSDLFLSLQDRARIANEQGAAAFVSLHFNTCSNPSVKGIEVFCHTHQPVQVRDLLSRQLATSVLKGVLGTTHTHDRGVKQANFAVIRSTHMPSILVEGGFLSHKEEARAIADSRYLGKLAEGIAIGLHRYFGTQPDAQLPVVKMRAAAPTPSSPGAKEVRCASKERKKGPTSGKPRSR